MFSRKANKRTAHFNLLSKRLLNSDDGREWLKYLQEDYINVSVLGGDIYETHCNIGKEDLVKCLIAHLTDADTLANIKTIKYTDDDDISYIDKL